MSASPSYKQDMPPEGGYKRILFARNPAKTYFNGKSLQCKILKTIMQIFTFNYDTLVLLVFRLPMHCRIHWHYGCQYLRLLVDSQRDQAKRNRNAFRSTCLVADAPGRT